MAYEIIIKPTAEKFFAKLPKDRQTKIIASIEQLTFEPRPIGVKKLKSQLDLYRIRVGDYRIIYTINDNILTITIVKIGHRKDVYNK